MVYSVKFIKHITHICNFYLDNQEETSSKHSMKSLNLDDVYDHEDLQRWHQLQSFGFPLLIKINPLP